MHMHKPTQKTQHYFHPPCLVWKAEPSTNYVAMKRRNVFCMHKVVLIRTQVNIQTNKQKDIPKSDLTSESRFGVYNLSTQFFPTGAAMISSFVNSDFGVKTFTKVLLVKG
mmetsp:Transcript_34075/g.42066  ORF Transcript_34075/g.42066 Transcript_34075/m.42066 type:complete len:110 (-) Transcript_34075:233-562(-)